MQIIAALTLFATCIVAVFSTARLKQSHITQEELARRTQELFDAVAPGDKTPWNKYIAEDALYFDEKGRNMNKAALVADIAPLPNGYTGKIRLANVQSHIEGNIAIMSYDLDEKENIFGQDLSARYHETDTWMFRRGQWQIVAGQVLRYYEDPTPGELDLGKLPAYTGTYEIAPDNRQKIFAEGKHLFRQRGDRPRENLIPEAGDIFFRKGVEGRILFHFNGAKVDKLIDRRNNEDVVWKKIN